MKHLFTLAFSLFTCALFAQKTFDVTIADSTYHMKQYWFVLYTTGPDTTFMDSVSAASMLQAHLEHQDAQGKRGLIIMGGPFGDDSDWRGLLLYDCDTREEVEGYLKQDPFVRAGRLAYEVHPWYGAVGTSLK